jgi:hypothetical protein
LFCFARSGIFSCTADMGNMIAIAIMQMGEKMTEAPAYGLCSLVVIYSLIFIIFALSFAKPQTNRDWRNGAAL